MAANLSNRVLYRSPDALQNLRLKVTLTRVSGPRMDRAREMDERFGAGDTSRETLARTLKTALSEMPRKLREGVLQTPRTGLQ